MPTPITKGSRTANRFPFATRSAVSSRTEIRTGADVNYGKIRAEARIQDLEKFVANRKGPLLIDCWATWCKNCAAMDVVMKDEKVKKALEPFEVIHVQAEDISELRKAKGFESIKGLPAFVIFE